MDLIQQVLTFWFDKNGYAQWFGRDDDFDAEIAAQFKTCHHHVLAGHCTDWLDSVDGRLASIIVLDQFSRNLYRGTAAAFAGDGEARAIAQAAIAKGEDQRREHDRRLFYYLPFEHSENREDQALSLKMLSAMGIDHVTEAAQIHFDIIARFGRFPHRNAALGRATTTEEAEYLKTKLSFY